MGGSGGTSRVGCSDSDEPRRRLDPDGFEPLVEVAVGTAVGPVGVDGGTAVLPPGGVVGADVGTGWVPISTTTWSDGAVKLRSSCATAWFEMRLPFAALDRTWTTMLIVTGWLFWAVTVQLTVLLVLVHEPFVAAVLMICSDPSTLSRTTTWLALVLLLNTESV